MGLVLGISGRIASHAHAPTRGAAMKAAKRDTSAPSESQPLPQEKQEYIFFQLDSAENLAVCTLISSQLLLHNRARFTGMSSKRKATASPSRLRMISSFEFCVVALSGFSGPGFGNQELET
jgi:hypothetical protein